ncbi:MAG: hypothetical protein AVDCRST_MAG41-3904, partial [uncultured Corynebacteriales bacterium]
MEIRKRLAAAAAAAVVVGGIAVVQSGVTGTPWPSSSPVRGGSSGDGLPAPGEAGGPPSAGSMAEPTSPSAVTGRP